MSISGAQRAELVATTRGAAQALVEDIHHLRETLRKAMPTRAELRRISAVVRRFLIDGDLSAVGAPRIGKIHILGPDNEPAYRLRPPAFFGSGGASVLGVEIRAASAHYAGCYRPLEDFDPDRRVPMRIDNFLSQRVLCVDEQWISRRVVLKFLANVASGVHSATPIEDEDVAIARARRMIRYTVEGTVFTITTDRAAFDDPLGGSMAFDTHSIDPALVELLAAIRFVVESPDVIRLEQLVTDELGL